MEDKWNTTWEIPSEDDMKSLAAVLFKHIRYIDPKIVELIVKDNNLNLNKWSDRLREKNVDPGIYLWKDSPCVFPGIRRHSGKSETNLFRQNNKGKNHYEKTKEAILLDDNSYPKQIWSWIIRDKQYDKTNPTNYHLAHIFDHKDYRSKNKTELSWNTYNNKDKQYQFSGLYTSATNTCFVPSSLLKPTDHNGKLRRLLQKIQMKLYSEVCTVLPYNLELSDMHDSWPISEFEEPKIVGNIEYAKNFITDRKMKIDKYLNIL